jgi:hypothetical protein
VGTASTAAAAGQAERLSAEARSRRGDTKSVSAGGGRSPARATMLIVGGVVVVVVALVLVLSSGGGGKSAGQGSAGAQSAANGTTGSTSTTSSHKHASSHQGESSAPAASPASTSVAVLNGTNTTGLAHSLAQDLQQSGYSQATALNGTPPGTHSVTLVEYTSGHRADAQGVASALGVALVQPMETTVSTLAGPAIVVVVAGADKAAAVSSTETSSGGGAGSASAP